MTPNRIRLTLTIDEVNRIRRYIDRHAPAAIEHYAEHGGDENCDFCILVMVESAFKRNGVDLSSLSD
ncbi:MAG: hypothetical protein ACFB9N_05035 [Geitlerinemataceae cyanobacterium]